MSRVTKAAGPADAHGAGTCWPFQRSRVCTGRTALSAALGLLSQPMASLHDLTRPWIWEGAAGPLREELRLGASVVVLGFPRVS